MKDDIGFDQYGVKTDLRLMFSAIQNLIAIVENNQNMSKIDLKSNLYKKKLKPLLDRIKETSEFGMISKNNN